VEPKKENKKFSVGLFIAIIFLVGALAALGFFGYKFYQQDRADRAQWAASYADRATPVPTSAVTPKETAATDAEDTEGTISGTSTASASGSTSSAASAAAKTKTPTPTPTPEPTPEVELMPTDNLQSLFACLIRGSDGTVLLDKNADQRMYPASMAKVMTTIVCLENLTDLTEKITVYPEDIDPAFLAEASMAGFEPYEEVTALDLLFGVMLPSGAEACSALATKVAGSEEAFVKMMNDKAVEIGLIVNGVIVGHINFYFSSGKFLLPLAFGNLAEIFHILTGKFQRISVIFNVTEFFQSVANVILDSTWVIRSTKSVGRVIRIG
jgi:hypothetical protein